jgi:hypothetical protein
MITEALSPSPRLRSPNHVLSHLRMLGDAGRIGLLLRYSDRQEQLDGHTELPTDLLMHRYRTLALSRFKIGEIALGDFDGGRKLVLRHGAPFAQHPNGVLVSRQPIDNSLWQHDLETRRDLLTRVAHDASCTDILVVDKFGQPLVLALRKNGELLAACGLDELNLGHDFLLHQQQQGVAHIRHPEVPERSEGLEGRRPPKLAIAHVGTGCRSRTCPRSTGRSSFEASPAQVAGVAPQDDGDGAIYVADESGRFVPFTADRDISGKLNIAYCDNWRRQ